jgi:uncharacterized protein YdbL (DUF1318 family)
MKKLVLALLIATVSASAAHALDLRSARASGVVAETPEGYIKAVKPSAEVSALVAEVNAKRRAEYTRISKQNGQSVELVGRLAAPEIAKNAASGN